MGEGHCCTCSRVCIHIGGPYYCDRHGFDLRGLQQNHVAVPAKAPCDLDELRAARTACDTGDADAFEKVLEVFPSLIEELDEARKEIARLSGFEPCRATMGAGTEHWFCGIERRSHASAMDNYKRHKSASKSVHDFLSGAFDDATKEGK